MLRRSRPPLTRLRLRLTVGAPSSCQRGLENRPSRCSLLILTQFQARYVPHSLFSKPTDAPIDFNPSSSNSCAPRVTARKIEHQGQSSTTQQVNVPLVTNDVFVDIQDSDSDSGSEGSNFETEVPAPANNGHSSTPTQNPHPTVRISYCWH